MPDNLKELQARVSQAPESPGVYRWLNAKGEVLYIGKAKNLRSRLRSYVQDDPDKNIGPWKLSLIKHIADFDMTTTANELEALILETNMIKEVKPKYNVLMKDDKNYVYVRVSDEEYSEVSVVRRMEEDKAKYFGPYLSAYEIKRTLDMLHEVFGFRACTASVQSLNRGKTPAKGCMEEQIGQCNGLCIGKITKDRYCDAVQQMMRFLKGDFRPAVETLLKMMQTAAAEKKFEKAGKLRDTLLYIQSLSEQQVVSDTSRENTDAIGITLRQGKGQIVVLRERGGKLIDERSFTLTGEADRIAPAISELIPQYYAAETDIPDLILIQEEIKDRDVLQDWLREVRGKKTEIRAPERGKKSKLLAMAESNSQQKIDQQFAKWEAAAKNIDTALEELKDALHLKDVPKRIEGYDISHLGGTETVGSMVVMRNGKPANKEYRSFTLRTVKEGEIDDYKALKEVLRRRLRYLMPADAAVTVTKLKKKELTKRMSEAKDRLAVPKKWREEVITVLQDGKEVLICDMRRTAKEKTLYGTLRFAMHDGDAVHRTMDALEEYYGTLEWYVQCTDMEDTDMLSVHGLVESIKDIPAEFSPKNTVTFHRRKTPDDVSLASLPDLLVIDGGKGQLSAVVEVLQDLNLMIPVIGLAKREEEVFIPGSSLPIDLPKNSQAGFLLQRLRDEAHRSANAHREKRLAKGMIGSALDLVPGIGEITKNELLRKFGSVDAIKNANDSDLLSVLTQSQLRSLRGSLH